MLDKQEETQELTESTESGCFLNCFRNLLEGSDLAAALRELRAKLLSNGDTEDKVVTMSLKHQIMNRSQCSQVKMNVSQL